MATELQLAGALEEITWMVEAARAPRLRSLRQFAEQEIVIPEGPAEGRKWRAHRQPYGVAIFDLIDQGPWRRRAFLGCVQSGKTFHAFLVPLLWYLFEHRDKVVCGVPTMDLAHAKWADEIWPVILRTRYAELLPKKGAGSRGGSKLEEVRFGNGAVLKFMSGHGGDEKRSGFTARVVVATEVDKFDTAAESSREADPISQLEARTDRYDGQEEVTLECTVSIEEGRIWQEYTNGTQSRFVHECPHCHGWVGPEREDLLGWQDGETRPAARRQAYFACPGCRERITEKQRYEMVQGYRVIHRGQEITPEGQVTGQPAETDTLGLRWSAFQNLFWSPGKIGAREWSARRARDRENAEKLMRQFVWSLPHESADVCLTPLDPDVVARRQSKLRKGLIPADCLGVAVGVDTGKRKLHWLAMALLPDNRRAVLDYGDQAVAADELGVRRALVKALGELQAYFLGGWQEIGAARRGPDQVWIDSGYHEHTDAVYEFCRQANGELVTGSERWRPSKGYGEGQQGATRYSGPKQKSREIRYIGREFHLIKSRRAAQMVVHVNSDHWKGDLRQGLAIAPAEPEAVLLYEVASPSEHNELIAHLMAEEPKEELNSKGVPVIVWKRIRRQNHWLDAGYAAAAACELIRELHHAKQTQDQPEGWFAAQRSTAKNAR